MDALAFHKMQALGNDFVVVDRRGASEPLTPELIRRIADRRHGVGCDQLLLLEPSTRAEVFMRVYNPDGSEAEACGNGTRCVARWIMERGGVARAAIETVAGVLEATAAPEGYGVDMGAPRFAWQEIPLAEPQDTLHLDLSEGSLADPVAVSMGNPHVVFFVDDAEAVPLEVLGPRIERHRLFPERVNVGVAQVRDRHTLRLRVFERGAGLTRACGSGACAALVAAVRRDLTERAADLLLDGGLLRVTWNDAGRVVMTGPAEYSFMGELGPELLRSDAA